jgi:hypothetical protein
MAAENATFRVELVSAKLYVRSKTVHAQVIEAHRELLKARNFRVPFTEAGIKTYQIGKGLTSASFPNIFTDKLPKRMIIALANQERVTGKYSLNPFKFENFGLVKLGVTVGGKSIPAEPLTMDYATGDYQRAYLSTLGALGLDTGNQGLSIAPELWASAYNLYAFKLVAGPIGGSVESTQYTGAVNLTFDFKAAVVSPIEILVYSETNRCLEITATNKAFVI